MGYRQLQQERVQLLIGQSTLQIQEQSTLGTMQQSSLQHYSVLGRILGNCTESTDRTRRVQHGWCRSRKLGRVLGRVMLTSRMNRCRIIQETWQGLSQVHADFTQVLRQDHLLEETQSLTRIF